MYEYRGRVRELHRAGRNGRRLTYIACFRATLIEYRNPTRTLVPFLFSSETYTELLPIRFVRRCAPAGRSKSPPIND